MSISGTEETQQKHDQLLANANQMEVVFIILEEGHSLS